MTNHNLIGANSEAPPEGMRILKKRGRKPKGYMGQQEYQLVPNKE